METAVKPGCSERVYRAGNFGGSPCFRTGTIEVDGKWYCTQHSPEAKEKRKRDQRARWAAERDASDRREAQRLEVQRRAKLFPALLEALEDMIDEQNGPPLIERADQWQAAMDKAQAAIKAARDTG